MNSAYLHSASEVIAELHERGFFADCSHLVSDSRKLGAGDVFVALAGAKFDARTLADTLLEQGKCGLVLVDYDPSLSYEHAAVVPVKGLPELLGEVASKYYGTDNLGLKVIAVTGTNGKTTVTRWLAQTLQALGLKAGVVGTLGWGEPDNIRSTFGLTTPDVLSMHLILYQMASLGFTWVCVEASSIGIDQGRLAGVPFKAAVYTNLTQDHLDYHKTMQAYAQAKAKLASWPSLSLVVINNDDAFSREFGERAAKLGKKVVSVGRSEGADLLLQDERVGEGLMHWRLSNFQFDAAVVGEFNILNASQVFALLHGLGVAKPHQISAALETITPAPGRMEVVNKSPLVVIDYAHTPDALEKALCALRPIAQAKQGRLLLVFGCGGDRDTQKRPVMGAIAANLADQVYVTADNPRSESVSNINAQIISGVSESRQSVCVALEDRAMAVMACLDYAGQQDVILLAGKGHETTQTVLGVAHPYSDTEAVREALEKLKLVGAKI